MRLLQNLPKEDFNSGESMKIYIGALQKPLTEILDSNNLENNFSIRLIHSTFPETKTITFVRHLESKYNEYKELIKADPKYQAFIQEKDHTKKEVLAHILLKDFFENVGIDYETNLSEKGKQDGEKLSKLYAELIKNHPEAFPDIIYVSPYLRTRLTTHYLLKNIEGLNLDFEKLINEEKLEDLIIGQFKGKDVILKIDERIRERDHGSNVAPSFIRDFWDEKKGFGDLINKKQQEEMHYYTAPAGGESQVQVNERARNFLSKVYEKEEYQNVLIISHHLTIIGALLSIFGGSFQSFYKLNELWKPKNGSLTTISHIPETEAGNKNKFRVSGYNLSLEE